MAFLQGLRDLKREMRDAERFLAADPSWRAIAFYSERDIYWRYLEGFAEAIASRGQPVSYITSDRSDPIFERVDPRLHPFFVKNTLPSVLERLDSRVLLMTMPDIGQFHIKRAPVPVHHVYAFHALVSTHLQYRKGAFDRYDAVLCAGPHHVEEIRKAEKIYGLKPKTLVECGYPFLEKLYREHQTYGARQEPEGRKKILIAPTWGKICILNTCIRELLDALAGVEEYEVVVRPHPEFIKREPSKAASLEAKIKNMPRVSFDADMLGTGSLHEADLLITDQSGIAFEYALGTERPVLFIDTPLKINNPDYADLGIEPIEVRLRSKLGVRLPLGGIAEVMRSVRECEARQEEFKKEIRAVRSTYVFNWLRSAEKGAEYACGRITGGVV